MAILYKDNLRNQLVFIDEMDEKDIDELNKEFKYYITTNLDIIYQITPLSIVNYMKNMKNENNFVTFLQHITRLSFYYFDKAGLKDDYSKYSKFNGYIHLYNYNLNENMKNMNANEKIVINGWHNPVCDNYKYNGNEILPLSNNTCIFCIQKDEDIEGGDLMFYPHYNNEKSFMNTIYYTITGNCSIPHTEFPIPLNKGKVIVLTGDTWHKLESMKMKCNNSLYLIIASFCNGLKWL